MRHSVAVINGQQARHSRSSSIDSCDQSVAANSYLLKANPIRHNQLDGQLADKNLQSNETVHEHGVLSRIKRAQQLHQSPVSVLQWKPMAVQRQLRTIHKCVGKFAWCQSLLDNWSRMQEHLAVARTIPLNKDWVQLMIQMMVTVSKLGNQLYTLPLYLNSLSNLAIF